MKNGTMPNEPLRTITAQVKLNGADISPRLKSFTIERVGADSKFFGFGICQKLNMTLIDNTNDLQVGAGDNIIIQFDGKSYTSQCNFYVKDIERDKVTNEVTVTAYDELMNLSELTVDDLNLAENYSLGEFVQAVAGILNVGTMWLENFGADTIAGLYELMANYEQGANFEGTENLRDAMDSFAEALQCIYYVTNSNLVLKRLKADTINLSITPADYFTLTEGEKRTLGKVVNTTELGDGFTLDNTYLFEDGTEGTTQYIRDNPFLELHEDAYSILENGYNDIFGLSITEFDCTWRGNYLLEIGDCIEFVRKDGTAFVAYVLDDVITYNGAYSQKSMWKFEAGSEGNENEPTTLTEVLTKTFAKVDKVNKEITLLASEAKATEAKVSQLIIDTEGINASVEGVKQATEDAIGNLGEGVAELTERVNAQMTEAEVNIAIEKAVTKGAEKVETSTGFKLDENGLEITKSDSDFSTQITEDGMTISEDGSEVLKANNEGVNAKNLHATTYLIVGENSRFEDYERDGESRTGCFWIGG
jgi:hypothetical protein